VPGIFVGAIRVPLWLCMQSLRFAAPAGCDRVRPIVPLTNGPVGIFEIFFQCDNENHFLHDSSCSHCDACYVAGLAAWSQNSGRSQAPNACGAIFARCLEPFSPVA